MRHFVKPIWIPIIVIVTLLASGLAGCGKKGDPKPIPQESIISITEKAVS